MTKQRYLKIIEEARSRIGSVVDPPVPVERLLADEGIRLVFEPLDDRASGIAYHDGSRRVIGVNGAHSYRRQRFTIAHELGHLVLHEQTLHIDDGVKIVGHRKGIARRDPKEREADLFASELLMPDALVRCDLVLIGKSSLEAFTRRLAARYEVSEQAMTIRLADYVDLILANEAREE